MTKQNVLMHNPASELDLPRMEKRLPGAALTLAQVDTLLAVPNVADPLGIRDRAMLELFYSCGLRRLELCHLDLPDFNADRRTLHIRRGKGKKRSHGAGGGTGRAVGRKIPGRSSAPALPGHADPRAFFDRLRWPF